MGGLDSRWMLSPVNPSRIQTPIRSLTTLSTPHRGSPIADLLDSPEKLLPFGSLPFGLGGDLLEQAFNALGISLDGLRDLTTERCQRFSAKFVNDPAVAYFSVAGKGRAGFPETAAAFLLFHKYISALTGQPNDGLVGVDSAQWGRSIRTPGRLITVKRSETTSIICCCRRLSLGLRSTIRLWRTLRHYEVCRSVRGRRGTARPKRRYGGNPGLACARPALRSR